MTYSTDKITKVESWTATDYDADDLALDVDVTTCMINATDAEDCDEWKEGVLNCKVEIDVPASSINTLKVRFYFNTVHTAGNNALLPYTGSSSVSNTNEVVQDYTIDGQWIEHECSAEFIAELGDVEGKTYVRLASGENGTSGIAKSKLGEVQIDIDYDTYKYEGITKDKNGGVLGGCYVALFKNEGGTPPTYTFKAATTSDAVTGAYSFTGHGDFNAMVYSIKLDSPHVFDATDNVITGVME